MGLTGCAFHLAFPANLSNYIVQSAQGGNDSKHSKECPSVIEPEGSYMKSVFTKACHPSTSRSSKKCFLF